MLRPRASSKGPSTQLEMMITITEDELRLARMGYQQEFRRTFKWIHNFGFSLSHMCPLLITSFYPTAVHYGGPSGALYTWLAASALHLCVSFSLAEICSAWPSSGGLYYWSAKLGGPRYGPILSWYTAYLNLFGEVGALASYAFGLSLVIFSCASFYTPDFEAAQWQVGLLSVVFVVMWGLINSSNDTFLARIMEVAIFFQVLGCLIVVITLLASAPLHQTPSFIFATFAQPDEEEHDMHVHLYATLINISFPSWVYIGYDSSAHISEETVNAYKGVSKSIVYSIMLTSVLGFLLVISLSSTIQTPDLIGDNPFFSYSPILPFSDATQNPPLAFFLSSLVAAAMFFGGLAVNTVNSRMMFAFARDDGFGRYLSAKLRVMHPKTRVPLHAVWAGCALAIVLLALSFGVPYGGVQGTLSISTVGLLLAYAIPIFAKVAIKSGGFEPGEFTLGSRLSIFMGWTAVLWVLFLIVVLCLPSDFPITPDNFNFSSVVLVAVLVFITLAWLITARRWYTGPVRRVDEFSVAAMERSIMAAKDALAEIGHLSHVAVGDVGDGRAASYARMS